MHSLFLNNELAGQDAEQLQNEIADCGVTGFKRKRTSGENKSNPKAARNMLRKCLKHSQWPQIYVAEIRTFHPKMQIEILQDMAFILPHELLFALGDFNSVDTLTTLDGAATSVKNHCQAAAALLQCPVAAMGLWCDGTPFNWERTKSLEFLLINFPGYLNRTKPGGSLLQQYPMNIYPREAHLKIFFKLWLGLFSNAFLVQCPIQDATDCNLILQIPGGRKKQANFCLAKQSLLKSGLTGNAKAKFFIYHIGTKMMVCAADALPHLHPSKIFPALHLGGMKG